ncbi:MAG: hypothetical protein J6V44_07330 [Methanobrevibacter sp.]|nr:hypothetical protein [Methanobrevibacter sp.]
MDLVDILGNTFDYLLEIPDRVKKCVHEQVTHEERNNLIEYKRKKAIIDKLKEKYGLTGAGTGDDWSWCNIELELLNEKYSVIYCENASSTMDRHHFTYIPDFKWKWPEPTDQQSRWAYLPGDSIDDYYLTWENPVPIKEDATFEEVEAILLRLMERFKELKSEYKEKKAADDFDPTAALFESLKSHYHLIEPEKSINATRYAYSPDIRYFVISYCKARNKIYVPSGLEQQEICLGGLEAFTLPDCWEMKCTEQTISATTFDEYKKYLDGILKQYKTIEQSKWEKYDI